MQNYNEDEDVMVTVELDDGTSIECDILTIFEVQDRDYIVLIPLDADGNHNAEGEVFLYRYSEDADGNPNLDNIETDEEYAAVEERFDEWLDESMYEEL
ncbi:MAG: DUF1292 domain-containing protein [Lachnospiraceae bacterium]|nr:DUF1292 domain-containing protein [Lachnospiraceae bacterium]